MGIKGILLPNHVQVNKYDFRVIGLLPLIITAISGLEEELDTTDLPDRTKATGGRTKAVEFDITIPAHELISQKSLEVWFEECKDPVLPTHKKIATLTMFNQGNIPLVTFTLTGVFPMKRALPDLELDNDGEMSEHVWSMSADEILPGIL